MSLELRPGLRGVAVTESSLSMIDGDAGRLVYRGYDIDDLAEGASYEEVLHLLWEGELPDAAALDAFAGRMASERALSERVHDLIASLAEADEEPMAALRTATSALSLGEDAFDPTDQDAMFARGARITAKLPTIVAAFERRRNGEEPVAPDPDLGHAANFLYMLTGEEPDDVLAETFDMALVLHADHGLNASTFTAMVTASTHADLNAAITAAVGALSGPRHGGANQNVMRMLLEIDDEGGDPVSWAERAMDEGRRVPGFGHPVYTVLDPRAAILREQSAALGEAAGDDRWYEYSRDLEAYMENEKGLAPNIDFYSASTYYQMGVPIDLYTPIFAMARVGGWIAHALEQYADKRVIRPRAEYTGATDRDFVPLDER
jgi:citrate synthase